MVILIWAYIYELTIPVFLNFQERKKNQKIKTFLILTLSRLQWKLIQLMLTEEGH